TDLTPELAACGERFLEGVLSAYAFQVTETHTKAGTIEIAAVYRPQRPDEHGEEETASRTHPRVSNPPRLRNGKRAHSNPKASRIRASIPEPERRLRETVVVPDLLGVDLAIKFVVPPDVDDPFAGDPDPIMACEHLDAHVALLLERLDDAVCHEVIRLDLPFHFLFRHAPLVRQDDLQLRFEPVLVQVDPHVRDEPIQDEASVDHEVLVGPRGHGGKRRCGDRYLMRPSLAVRRRFGPPS